MKLKLGFVAALVSAASMAFAPAAGAQQTGLINIAIEDNFVAVPISVAANICNVNLAVLAVQRRTGGSTDCTAVSEANAPGPGATAGNGGTTQQDGLINVIIAGNEVLVPIAAALNVCDVNAAVLALQEITTGEATCEAEATSGVG